MLGKGFLNSQKTNKVLVLAVDVVENLTTLSELDLPRSRHKQEVSTLEGVLHREKIKTNTNNNRTREIMTKMIDNMKARSFLFKSHLKGLCTHSIQRYSS